MAKEKQKTNKTRDRREEINLDARKWLEDFATQTVENIKSIESRVDRLADYDSMLGVNEIISQFKLANIHLKNSVSIAGERIKRFDNRKQVIAAQIEELKAQIKALSGEFGEEDGPGDEPNG